MAPRRLQRRVSSFSKKLHILQTLTNSKSVENSSIIMDAFLHILKLKLQLEELKREYFHILNIIQEVKVDKVEGRRFKVRVRCKKVEGLLVSILEGFEEMDISVVEARVSCNYFFVMEAIVEADDEDHQGLSVDAVTQAIHKAIQGQSEMGTCKLSDLKAS